MARNNDKNNQTNATAVESTAAAPAVTKVKGEKTFKVKNEKLGDLAVTVVVPTVSEEMAEAYFGEGEVGEKNRKAALLKFVAGARSRQIGQYLRGIESADDATAEKALASLDGLKFGARRRGAGSSTGRKVKRTTEDLTKAVAALGGMPKNESELAALLASLNISVGAAEAAKSE